MQCGYLLTYLHKTCQSDETCKVKNLDNSMKGPSQAPSGSQYTPGWQAACGLPRHPARPGWTHNFLPLNV